VLEPPDEPLLVVDLDPEPLEPPLEPVLAPEPLEL
jgi:hypothetical protein